MIPIYRTRPGRPSRLAFHLSRIVADVGVLLVLGSMSLPFVTAEEFRQKAVGADALPALLLVAPVFLMTLLPDLSVPLPRPLGWASLALAAAAVPFAVVKYFDASTVARTIGGGVGMGARVLVMGAVVVLAGAVLGLLRPPAQATAGDPETAPAEAAAAAAPARRAPAPQPAAVPPGRRAARPQPAPSAATLPAVPPVPPARSFPRFRRPGAAPADAVAPSPRAAAPRPSSRAAAPPRPADPDTEPTLPEVPAAPRPAQAWWPDDLEDLFS